MNVPTWDQAGGWIVAILVAALTGWNALRTKKADTAAAELASKTPTYADMEKRLEKIETALDEEREKRRALEDRVEELESERDRAQRERDAALVDRDTAIHERDNDRATRDRLAVIVREADDWIGDLCDRWDEHRKLDHPPRWRWRDDI